MAPSGGQDENCTFYFLMDKFIVFWEAVNPRGTADSVTNSAIAESRFPGGSNYKIIAAKIKVADAAVLKTLLLSNFVHC